MTALMGCITAMLAVASHAPVAPGADTLEVVRRVTGNQLPIEVPGIAALSFAEGYRHAGSQRFVLRDVADVEQHAFVRADPEGQVQQFYWIQVERFLDRTNSTYDYSSDAIVHAGSQRWRGSVRRYDTAPEPGGDRHAFYSLVSRSGLDMPSQAARILLIQVTAPDRRSELLIIYGEAGPPGERPVSLEDLAEAAGRGMQVIAGPGIATDP